MRGQLTSDLKRERYEEPKVLLQKAKDSVNGPSAAAALSGRQFDVLYCDKYSYNLLNMVRHECLVVTGLWKSV